jgi:hypothetical protein
MLTGVVRINPTPDAQADLQMFPVWFADHNRNGAILTIVSIGLIGV